MFVVQGTLCLELKFLLFPNERFLISNKLHSDVMDFQLHSCETVGIGICITRMGTSRNCNAYTLQFNVNEILVTIIGHF